MLPSVAKSKRLIYLDYAATTPLDPRVQKVMEPFWTDTFGNPSSLYSQGRKAAQAVAKARKIIADIIGSRSDEIVFTAGGSESINLAIFGVARSYALRYGKTGHIITSTIEHHSVLHSCRALEQEGWNTSYVPVGEEGFINLDKLTAAVRPDTILVSIMYANNETGTIEPIAEIGKWLKALNAERANRKLPQILFHTDACQAAGALELDVHKLGLDLMTVNGSKIYGPKQTGFLYVKNGAELRALIYGGGQEKNRRSGTENVPGIIGLAEALRLVQKNRLKENKRLIKLRDYFIGQLFKKIPGIILNGPSPNKKSELRRLPNNINVSFPGVEGETILLYLDAYNIAVSTGSACSTASTDTSHVLAALGRRPAEARGSIRLTLGSTTTAADIAYILKILPKIVVEVRRMASPFRK